MAACYDKVELRIPGRPEFVSVARLAVSAVASRMVFDFEDLDDIKLAVGEACTNAIQHASPRQLDEIVIECALQPERLVIEVRDRGVGFDPSGCPKEVEPEELPSHGYGLLLIQALMDEVECKSSPGEGTLVRMIKRVTKPTASA